MKRLLVLIAVPLMLFGLERVNLIKNHSFEKEDSSWSTYTGTWKPAPENDSAQASSHDQARASKGLYSASTNTSSQPGDPTPPATVFDSATIIQGFQSRKLLGDLDSLSWSMKVFPTEAIFDKLYYIHFSLIIEAGSTNWIWGVYRYYGPLLGPAGENAHRKVFNFELTDDTSWISCRHSVKIDWIDQRGLPSDYHLDSVALVGCGSLGTAVYYWIGQKAYWDDIRLTGYADYDVGVKGILSGDSVKKSTGYTPTARIKNFGRKPADSFLVIAEIRGSSGTVYADTLPYALPADTEDTVSFKEFTPPDASNYTLTVSTLMTPDESDEDDEMSKTLYGSGIVEPVTPTSPSAIQLEVTSLSSIRYSIPSDEQATLTVYDPSGRRIESYRVQGSGSVNLKSNLSSGVYFIKLEAGKASVTKKAVFLR